MQITTAALRALRTTISTIFQGAYSNTATWSDRVATVVSSTTASNTYKWFLKTLKLREWLGERVIQNLESTSYTLRNKRWEGTVEIDRDDVEDDNIGVHSPMISELGEAARRHPDRLIVDLLRNGELNECFDGQFFFDTDHPVKLNDASGGTYSNYFTATPLTAANYEAVRAAMMSRVDDVGDPLEVMPNLLIVPPQLGSLAKRILKNETVNEGGVAVPNVNQGTAEILELVELSNDPTVWYLLCTSKAIKPIIIQMRRAPAFASKDADTDDNVFDHAVFKYGVWGRWAAGYTLPFLAAKARA
jgi:phage major head subunit gpT-like protein